MSYNDLDFDLFGDSIEPISGKSESTDLSDLTETDLFGYEDDETDEKVEEATESQEESSDVEQEVPEEDDNFDIDGAIEKIEELEKESARENSGSDNPIGGTPDMEDTNDDISGLLEALEAEIAKDDSDEDVMSKIIDELRLSNSEKEMENEYLRKQIDRYKQRDLERADSDFEYSNSKPIIEKVNSNPKVKELLHYMGSINDTGKERFSNILADLYEQETGINIASLIEKNQQSEMSSSFAGGSGTGLSFSDMKEKENSITKEESLNDLF